jgi:hypothetical protein
VFINADTAAKNSLDIPKIIPSPVIIASKNVFRDSVVVEIKSLDENSYVIYYDPLEKNFERHWKKVTSRLIVDSTCIVRAIAKTNEHTSTLSVAHFYKMAHPKWKVNLLSKYSPQYTGGGDEALIDGLRGTEDWRKGSWQGYQSQDFECVIDLGEEKYITKLNTGFLQDVGAWILFPKKVTFEISKDGKKFSHIAEIETTVSDKDEKVQVKDFTAEIKKKKARYIKVKAVNYGKLPPWHAGAGGDAWIFVDEVRVE